MSPTERQQPAFDRMLSMVGTRCIAQTLRRDGADRRQRVLDAVVKFFQDELVKPVGGFALLGVDAGLVSRCSTLSSVCVSSNRRLAFSAARISCDDCGPPSVESRSWSILDITPRISLSVQFHTYLSGKAEPPYGAVGKVAVSFQRRKIGRGQSYPVFPRPSRRIRAVFRKTGFLTEYRSSTDSIARKPE